MLVDDVLVLLCFYLYLPTQSPLGGERYDSLNARSLCLSKQVNTLATVPATQRKTGLESVRQALGRVLPDCKLLKRSPHPHLHSDCHAWADGRFTARTTASSCLDSILSKLAAV